MTETSVPARRLTGRSPAYPAINLETAIRRARELYDKERQHPTPVDTIVRHWSYKSLNGPANQALAALKKFGLLTDEGRGTDRRCRVSHLAVEILANPNPGARASAIKEAALTPTIHRELWDKYQNSPPSHDNLRWELIRQRGFTESGAEEFIREYKQTVTFAQLDANDRASGAPTVDVDEDEDTSDVVDERPATRSNVDRVTVQTGAKRFPIPLFDDKVVVIEGDFPLPEEDWNQFMTVLNVFKPTLVIRSTGD